MSEDEEFNIEKLPVIRTLAKWCKKVKIPGTNGLSLYHLLEIYGTGIIKGTFSSRASSIAYSFFIAIFPFLLFILNLIPYFDFIDGFLTQFLIFIEELLPPQTADLFYPVIADIAVNPRGGLLSFSIILAIFLSANGVNAIFSAFEYSVHVTINRTFVRQYAVAFGVAILLALLLLTTVGVILYGEYLINELVGKVYVENNVYLVTIMQLVIFISMIYTIISILYYFGTKQGKESHFFSFGALLTTILFLVTTYLFGIYINNFSNYNELYGSLGALLIMLFYIWINSNLLLLGFELNVSLQLLKDRNKNNNTNT
ncbi:YihY/virulence factor BrkB family protein [uncultured Marixanthomonas sp.]|uniref:YihY/virulence factor BrkB family protein n=1 Tax=uncultured Marixanthomonas sp. TaxID=757245 RepID=UPI0030D9B6DA|tara:strand:+ start:7344 stop:8285 length:942 start_codon:yes stop_codon:yes gene_type:complete